MAFNQNTVDEYLAEFAKAYGEGRARVKAKYHPREGYFVGYAVSIDGDASGKILSNQDMKDAIEQFRK